MTHPTSVRPAPSARCVVAAVLLALPAVASAQISSLGPAPEPGPTLAGATHGAEALAALGARLDQVAARNGVDADGLRAALRDDPTLWLTADERLVYVDRPAPQGETAAHTTPAADIPLEDAFLLHSRPGCNKVIYLDFDGHHSKGNGWGHNIVFPAFDTDGDPSSFSTGEIQSIIAHWQYISEDYWPFEVDVTTEEPPEDYLRKATFGDTKWGVRVVLTQYAGGFGVGTGGIALLGSFTDFDDTPCFVFNKGDNNGSMSASHEAGHTLGLFHDGLNGSEYHPGTGSGATSWGPIMGAPFGKTVVQWSIGDYAGATSTQDDTNYIASFANGTPYKADDFADTVGAPSALPIACPDTSLTVVSGFIGRRTDVDAFAFDTSGGTVTISADPYELGPDLDIQLQLFTAAGGLLATDDPTNATNASITQNLPAGSYVITLDGVGKSGVYSDYGSLGQYTLTVDAPPTGSFATLGGALAGSTGLPSLIGTGLACEGEPVALDLTNAKPSATAFLVFGLGQLNLPFKGGTLVPDITLGGFFGLATDGSGAISLPFAWGAGTASGFTLDFQYWIQDAAGPHGYAASNAVEAVVP
ncbi:MAG: hypothetical protein H6825_00980 [Planctomycetes bacterium]|nr:hypothetical protein [Planctomycetota bacterium]